VRRILAALAAGLSVAPAFAQEDPRIRERVPASGVEEQIRRGPYVETTLGLFTTLFGSAGFSRAQPYLGFAVGRDVAGRHKLFASLGIGASSANCFAPAAGSGCSGPDSFGATFAEVGGAFGIPLAPRALLSVKAVLGVTHLSPAPTGDGGSARDHLLGFHAGGGLSFDYDTHLDHFAIGFDALLRHTLARYQATGEGRGTLGISSLALLPRVRYVF
jgi:hypothetical protein